MRKYLLAAGIAASALVAAAPASANVDFIFTPGPSHSPSGSDFTVVDDFNTPATALNGWTTGGAGAVVQSGSNTNGAQPSNSVPGDTPYLSVLGGGTATYTFSAPVNGFEFDWGSVDGYNTLTIFTNLNPGGYTRTGAFVPPANGDQSGNATNGLFTAFASPGELITGFKMESGTNSFEIDNVAVRAVPEPGAWALMILGFGGVGAAMRRRRREAMQFA
jgi:hypothetical protein